jgi:hypothetical protein
MIPKKKKEEKKREKKFRFKAQNQKNQIKEEI